MISSSGSLDYILSILDKENAQDVVSINTIGKSSITDFVVVASGKSNRHVISMGDKIRVAMKKFLGNPVSLEGIFRGDWVLIDCGDVVVHLFRPEVRTFYAIEGMWQNSVYGSFNNDGDFMKGGQVSSH